MQFKVDLKIFLFLILFYITGQLGEYAVILILAFVHELGHLLAGIILGMKPAKLELKPYGISISFKINQMIIIKKDSKRKFIRTKKSNSCMCRTTYQFDNNYNNSKFKIKYIYKFINNIF